MDKKKSLVKAAICVIDNKLEKKANKRSESLKEKRVQGKRKSGQLGIFIPNCPLFHDRLIEVPAWLIE